MQENITFLSGPKTGRKKKVQPFVQRSQKGQIGPREILEKWLIINNSQQGQSDRKD